MTSIRTVVHIARPVDAVFDYVTTPGNWPHWHPSSLGVGGAVDRSLEVGDQVTEAFRVARRQGRVVWTCLEREAPRRWIIRGCVDGGGDGAITYVLTPRNGGTRFERTFVYAMPHRLLEILNHLFFRRRIMDESRRALHCLKQVLEAA